jgi:hypothetical protein
VTDAKQHASAKHQMTNESKSPSGAKAFTLRRNGESPLKFNGERIGSATRTEKTEDDDGEEITVETSARLFKTTGGKYVAGVEEYDKTNEEYLFRWAEVSPTLEDLAKLMSGRVSVGNYIQAQLVDADILAELFEDTEIADQFVEHID